MKVLKLSALILSVALFLGLGSTTLSAKCGAGKCGSEMKAPKTCTDKNCGTDKTCHCEKDGGTCKCEAKGDKKAMKCGAGKCGVEKAPAKKCGGDKKSPPKKCGAGKCE